MSCFSELFGTKESVQATPELVRIEQIPRRVWTPSQLEWLADKMTEALKTPRGTQRLRPAQALALHDLGVHGGLFAPMQVGAGKTLVSLLAPVVCGAKNPLLLLPAALVEKTERERKALKEHWKIPDNLRLMSYEILGRHQAANLFSFYRPDLIGADEAHRLKHRTKAAVARRVHRYMKEHPDTKFFALSGTMMRNSLKDFAHIIRWCLKDNAPVPMTDGEVEEWADALDERVNPLRRRAPGALLHLAASSQEDDLTRARKGFQKRLLETPGVVATFGEDVSCSLYIRAIELPSSPITDAHFKKLREEWETPDGWALCEAVQVWRHAREISLGLVYVWEPRPPESWLEPRRQWAAFVREVLSRSRTLDTELQVALECKRGALRDAEFNAWQLARPCYTPTHKALWHDDAPLRLCQTWIESGPGIIWCEHTFFAEELSRRTGLDYYGAEGKNSRGEPIEKADPGKSLIASIAANSTGRNLQAWSRNLVTSPLTSASGWEQLLGRTHRFGQQADQVEVDVFLGCREHYDAWTRSLREARMIHDMQGHQQKLLLADVSWPSDDEINSRSGSRWRPSDSGSGRY